MKKLVLMLAVVFSMSFFACGNKEQAAEAEAPATEEVVAPVEEEVAVVEDSVLNDSTVEVAAAAADVVAE